MGADVTKKLEIIISSKANLTDAAKVSKAFSQVKTTLSNLNTKLGTYGKRMGGYMRQAQLGREKTKALEEAIKKQAVAIDKLGTKTKKSTNTLARSKKATMDANKSASIYRKEVDRLATSYRRTEKAARAYDNTHGNIRGHTEGLRRTIGALRNQILLFVFALRGLINIITSSVEASNQLEASLVGLEAVTQKTGASFYDANKFIKDFTETGLISVADTAAGLKNLLSAGFGMPEAINLMRTLGDAAAFNRQGTLEYGAAIVGATQGIKNQNSIMTDNAGITKNLNIMYKEFAVTLGKGAMSLNEMEKRQAIYQGFLKEGALFQGNMNILTTTYMGITQKLSQTIFKAKAAFGEMIKGGLKPIISEIEKVIKVMSDWIEVNRIMLRIDIKTFFDTLINSLKLLWDILMMVKGAFSIFGIGLKDIIIIGGTLKILTSLFGKAVLVLKGLSTTMKFAFGTQTVAAVANITKLRVAIWKFGLVMRSAKFTMTGLTKVIFALKAGLLTLLSPIGWVIAGITALVGGIVWLRMKSKEAAEELAEQHKVFAEDLRAQTKARYEETASLLESLKLRRESAEVTKLEAERLEVLIEMQEKLARTSRIDQGLSEAKEKFLDLAKVPEGLTSLLVNPDEWGEVFESRMRDSFKLVDKFGKLTDAQMDQQIEKQETSLVGKVTGLALLESQNEEYNITKNSLNDMLQHNEALTAIQSNRLKEAERESLATIDKLKRDKASLMLEREILRIFRIMRGVKKLMAEDDKAAEKAKKAALGSLLGLIARLEGEIKLMGLVGIAADLVKFETKIAVLEVKYAEFVKTLGAGNKHVERLRELLNDMAVKGPIDILADNLSDLQSKIDSLGMDQLTSKINKHNEVVKEWQLGLEQAGQAFSVEQWAGREGELWDEISGKIIEFDEITKQRLASDVIRKFAEESSQAIMGLSKSLFDLSAGMVQGPIFGGLFGAGEKGEVDRLRIQLEATQKLEASKLRQIEAEDKLNTLLESRVITEIQYLDRLLESRKMFETEATLIQEEETYKRIELARTEWQQRFDMIESLMGGWQQLGETIGQLTFGQGNEMEAQIERQRDLLDRGKIDIKEYHDRVKQIEKAAQKDKEQIQAKFLANMIRQAGQIAQQYFIQAAAGQIAGASSMAASATQWAAFFAAQAAIHSALAANPFLTAIHAPIAASYSLASGASGALAAGATVAGGIGMAALGAGIGVASGLVAGAIEANNLGSEGGFLGTPTEDVFEDRSKRLGGSIRAQEVHLSINPVTYITAEGDIFIGEGITIDTFKGLVNEAFINRANEAIEEGELQIDQMVTKG